MPELAELSWNFRDELAATSVRAASGGQTPERTFYVYDHRGQRVRKVTERQAGPGDRPGRKSEHVYLDGFEIFREYDGRGEVGLRRDTLRIMDGQECVTLAETRTEGQDASPRQLLRWQISNHLRSAVLEVDDRAQIISYEEYYPYGSTSYQAVRSRTEAPKRYRFLGRERDADTGLYYHGARYYLPWLARWAQPDPSGLADGLNLYRYASNNSISLADDTGYAGGDTKTEPKGAHGEGKEHSNRTRDKHEDAEPASAARAGEKPGERAREETPGAKKEPG